MEPLPRCWSGQSNGVWQIHTPLHLSPFRDNTTRKEGFFKGYGRGARAAPALHHKDIGTQAHHKPCHVAVSVHKKTSTPKLGPLPPPSPRTPQCTRATRPRSWRR